MDSALDSATTDQQPSSTSSHTTTLSQLERENGDSAHSNARAYFARPELGNHPHLNPLLHNHNVEPNTGTPTGLHILAIAAEATMNPNLQQFGMNTTSRPRSATAALHKINQDSPQPTNINNTEAAAGEKLPPLPPFLATSPPISISSSISSPNAYGNNNQQPPTTSVPFPEHTHLLALDPKWIPAPASKNISLTTALSHPAIFKISLPPPTTSSHSSCTNGCGHKYALLPASFGGLGLARGEGEDLRDRVFWREGVVKQAESLELAKKSREVEGEGDRLGKEWRRGDEVEYWRRRHGEKWEGR